MSISVGNTTITDGPKATYAASWAAFTLASSPTYAFSIFGSSTKTIRILRIGISATRTSAGITNIQLNKLSSALTGGSSAAPTGIVPFDSTSPAATATPLSWTANPTGGGAVIGALRNVKFLLPTTAPAGAAQTEMIFDYTQNFSQEIVLRGTSEGIGLTFLGATQTGNSVCCWIEWTEE